MPNDFYTHGSYPAPFSFGSSSGLRAELDSISAGFDKLPALTGNAYKIPFVSSGANSLTVGSSLYTDVNGNLGVGTSGPQARLQVSQSSAGVTQELVRLSNPGAGANTRARLTFETTSTPYGAVIGGYGASAPEMEFSLVSGTPGNFLWTSASTQVMRVDTTGNLVVGTGAPSNKLDVVGVDGQGLQFRTSTRTVGLGQTSGEASVFWGSTTALTFFSGSERARFDTGGRLLIGRTAVNATATKLGVEGRIDSVTTGTFASSFGSSSAAPFVLSNSSTGTEVEMLRVDGSGNLIPILQTAAPTLTINRQMVFTLTSNTNLQISVRGTDGVTRTANITLA